MKAMLAGFAAMIAISIGAYAVLENSKFSARNAQSGDNVRLDRERWNQ